MAKKDTMADRIERSLREWRAREDAEVADSLDAALLDEIPGEDDESRAWRIVARERARCAITETRDHFYEGAGSRTESPIELAMLAGLFAAALGRSIDVTVPHHGLMAPLGEGRFGPSVMAIHPQHVIGQYRVDFLVRLSDVGQKDGAWGFYEIQAVVECDGHDFHERTKEQAKRDRNRDRALQDIGFLVLRFTGSEIWSNPIDCALQVIDSLFKAHGRAYGGA